MSGHRSAPTLLILAAGMGSRYGGLKQVDPVGPNSEIILDYSIYDALRAGFGKIVFVIRRDIESAFKEAIGTRIEMHVPVEYVFQELDDLPHGFSAPAGRTQPWGTTHAVLSAANVVDEPFAIINADDFYGAEGYRLLAEHALSGSTDYAMIGFTLHNTLSRFGGVSRGVCRVNANGYLQEVVELTAIRQEGDGLIGIGADGGVQPLSGNEIVSMNMWGLNPAAFAKLDETFQLFLNGHSTDTKAECYLPRSINELMISRQARVQVLPSSDQWTGITYRVDRADVVKVLSCLIQSGTYPDRLWA